MQNSESAPTGVAPVSTNAADALALAGRVLIAAIFVISGASKLLDPASTMGYISAMGLPFPELGTGIAILVELGAGVALAIGYRTRAVATILALFSLATAVLFHGALGDQNQFIHFFKNVAMAGGLLQIIAFGSGALAISRK
jgi:putative oxidoreductase